MAENPDVDLQISGGGSSVGIQAVGGGTGRYRHGLSRPERFREGSVSRPRGARGRPRRHRDHRKPGKQKKRNVLSYLPKSEQANVSKDLTMAYREFEYAEAKGQLLSIAKRLEGRYPKATASILEGLEETLTVHRLKIPGLLRETLCSTNPMESANSACRGIIVECPILKMAKWPLRHARLVLWEQNEDLSV